MITEKRMTKDEAEGPGHIQSCDGFGRMGREWESGGMLFIYLDIALLRYNLLI